MHARTTVLAAAIAACVSFTAAGEEWTSDELIVRADSAYNQRNYAEAAALYQKFFQDFAKSQEPQVHEIIRRRQYELAMCQIRLKKFEEAADAIGKALSAQPPLDPSQIQELTFWKGVSALQSGEHAQARATLEAFVALFPPNAENQPHYVKQFPSARLIPEARSLIGKALLLDEKYAEAAAYFQKVAPGLPPADRGSASVLRLYALIEDGDTDAALALVKEQFPRMGEILQLAAFQALTLQLGDRLLQDGRLRDAIACLQRVWERDRTLRHQQTRLAELEARLGAAQALGDAYQTLSLGQQTEKVRREVEQFQRIENFDSALRMRLASAYQAMGRYRESALIMEQMLEEMPPDPIVEQASVNLIQSWNQIERWPKVIESAIAFEAAFPKSAQLPVVLYLRGIAEQKALAYPEAIATFERLAAKHPKSEWAPRAQFLKGFTRLLAEENAVAIRDFDAFLKAHPGHDLADAAAYWRGMGFSLDKQHLEARKAFDEYLAGRKDGAFRSKAFFRRAYCAQQLEDYTTSIRELGEYLREFPGAEETAEARVLLGDALMNEGRMEEGIAAMDGIPREDVRFYEEGVFKVAKALKLMEEYDQLRRRMEAFVSESPKSPRVAEAVFQIGWVHRQAGDEDKAREVYWNAIAEHGADPSIRSVDDLFPALARLYKGEEQKARLLARLRDLREEAAGAGQPVLAMRALWAQGNLLSRSDPGRARMMFVEASALANVQTTNPALLADFAEALSASGEADKAEALWRDLIKWNPRAPQKDRALAALGFLELGRGHEKAALGYFDRFERETMGSSHVGKVMLARAGLLDERGEFDTARRSLEALLASPYATGPEKCEALFRIGESHMREKKPARAVPYYQRIYVMHGKWRDWVARAYLRSGQAFEALDDTLSARRTYQELSTRSDLAEFEETRTARERLDALGGPLQDSPPAG